ncbi:tRNA pseudouridine(55) synthase TruB [Thiotrichales bacterium 19S11-10]|nr:tRNA pseudouridine(55) synthase TruB [Thiotrichales bacterium 19S11-10]
MDKPYGLSSNYALQQVKRLFNVKKAGHTGSLDPMATGMLPILFNQATKFSQYILDADKTYLATIQLGQTTDTLDKEGEITSTNTVPALDNALIETYLAQFRGKITQVPPMYSALKKDGQPLYALAREGISVERSKREVEIFELINCGYDQNLHQLKIKVHVSKGTYIRTLADDIGFAIGCGGHLISLRRVSCGQFDEANKIHQLDELKFQINELNSEKSTKLIEVSRAFNHWPVIEITLAQVAELSRSGRWLSDRSETDGWYVFRLEGEFKGIGQFEGGNLKVRKLLLE